MPIDHAAAPAAIDAFRARIDDVLTSFLDERRAELEALDPEATLLVDEVRRLVAAGGKRLRPVFCVWGYRAAGGRDDDRIERAGAAIELLHTMALIHDDLIHVTGERRVVPTSRPFLAGRLSSS